MAVSLIGATGMTARAQEPVPPPVPSPWEHVFSLRVGAGYNDNVTLAHSAPEQAPFIYSGLDAVFSRLPVDGNLLNLALTADDARFLGGGSVDNESLVLASGEARKLFASGWQPGLAAQWFYQDQVLDVSTTETNQEALPVRGHTVTARPGVRLEVSPRWWFALDAPVTRQFFEAPLDDYWEGGAKASLGSSYGHKSDLTASYEATHRGYDEDPALDAAGVPLGDESKALWQHDVRLSWRHYWDERRRWRTTARLGFKANRDNASGYFDFNRYQAAGQLRYRTKVWTLTGEAAVYQYYYPVQTTGDPGTPLRERTEVTVGVRCERQIVKAWQVFAEYDHERVMGNLALEEYAINKVKAGVNWTF